MAGILLRLLDEAGGWQVLFYRSLAFVATLLAFVCWRHGRHTIRAFGEIGRPGLAVAALLAGAMIMFIFALLSTSVANVVFTVGLSPFFAAVFGRVFLGEAVRAATWAAIAAALAGVALMFGDGLAAGGVAGNLLALGSGLCYAGTLVAMRGGRRFDMIPALCVAGVIAAGLSAVMAPDLGIAPRDLGIAVVLGVVQLGFQYILVATGTRSVPAAEAALVGRLTLVMAPLWVWLGVGEVPGELTLAGGAVVLAAVTGHGLFSLRAARGKAGP